LDNREILEHYNKQLFDVDFKIPYEQLLRQDDAVISLAELFNNFSKQKEYISKIYESTSTIFETNQTKRFRKSKITGTTRKDFMHDVHKFKNLIHVMLKVRKELNLDFSDNFIDELVTSLSFDYEKLLFDDLYKYYFQVSIEDGIILNVFLARGLQRNIYLESLYLQDLDFSVSSLDVAEQQSNEAGTLFLISFYNYL
jgi:hypothetical protein